MVFKNLTRLHIRHYSRVRIVVFKNLTRLHIRHCNNKSERLHILLWLIILLEFVSWYFCIGNPISKDIWNMTIQACSMMHAIYIPNQNRNLSREDSCTYDHTSVFMVTIYIPNQNTIFLERTHVHMTTQACSWWQSISQTKIQFFSRGLMYIWPHKHVHSDMLYAYLKPKTQSFSRGLMYIWQC